MFGMKIFLNSRYGSESNTLYYHILPIVYIKKLKEKMGGNDIGLILSDNYI